MTLGKEMKTWYGLIATLGTLGRYTKMPGTIGSITACAIWMICGGLPWWIIAVVAVTGTIAADKYEKACGRTDPGEVVIDEVVGCWISCLGLSITYAVVALFTFRIVDITKPFPINKTERLPGGLGIMADDMLGGVIVNIILRILHWMFFESGVKVISGMF